MDFWGCQETPRKNDYITIESVLYKHYQELNFEELIENKNYDLLRKYTYNKEWWW